MTSNENPIIPPPAGGPAGASAEAALPLRLLLERVDHGLALTDGAGRLRWCNTLLAECYLGGPRPAGDSPLGRPCAELFRPLFHEPEQWKRIESSLVRLVHSPKSRVEFENLSFGWGGCAVKRIDLVLCDLGEAEPPLPGWTAWYFYDTTALRRTEENLQVLLRHSSDGIFILDGHCRLRVFNEACERITGYLAEEVMQHPSTCAAIFNCAGGDCGRATEHEGEPGGAGGPPCFMRDPTHQTREMAIRTRSGGQVWVEVSFAPVLGEGGEVSHILGILRDITQRRALEEQVRLTRKLATLGELSGAMAHEIKNPLGIILSASEIIMNPNRSEEQRRQAAEFIRDEAKRLDERMRVFLSFSRPRPPEFKVQSVHRVLTQTIIAYETLAREGLAIETEFASSLPHVRIDADQMQQVFLNLVMNADQAMANGGTMTIATRRAGAGWIAVEVGDRGPGLPEGDPARLFEPFYSTKPRGTGLGLSIVMHIVVAHGGRIEARNRAGGGALFTVVLPEAEKKE